MKKVKISDLIPDNVNANRGTKRGSGMLERSLRQYGAGRSVLVDSSGRIIAGNKTVEAAGSIGLEDAVVVETDGTKVVVVKRTDITLDSPQGRGLAIADNRVGEVNLDWDLEALEKIGEELALGEFFFADELPDLDFDGLEYEDEGESLNEEVDTEVEVEEKAITITGDLWKLGEHRVLCGDSMNPEDLDRVMQGKKADLVFTDPPYNLAEKETLFASNNKPESYGKLKSSTWDNAFDAYQFLEGAFDFLADDVSIYVCASHHTAPNIWSWMGKRVDSSRFVVWSKPNPMPSLSKRHWTWDAEIICYGTRGKHVFNFPEEGHAPATWRITKSSTNRVHPTEKPIAVPTHAIKHSSRVGGLVLDCFLGSGSTLIAAHGLRRVCYGVEISPNYVDVIVRRWQELTGEAATLEDGRTFETVEKERSSNA